MDVQARKRHHELIAKSKQASASSSRIRYIAAGAALVVCVAFFAWQVVSARTTGLHAPTTADVASALAAQEDERALAAMDNRTFEAELAKRRDAAKAAAAKANAGEAQAALDRAVAEKALRDDAKR